MTEWFEDYAQPDYARTGNKASQTIVVKAGPVMIEDGVASHAIEPQLRKLGMPTKLVKGVPTLDDDFTICTEGEVLKPNQVNLLMQFNHLLSTVRVCIFDFPSVQDPASDFFPCAVQDHTVARLEPQERRTHQA